MDEDLKIMVEALLRTAQKKNIAVAGYIWGFVDDDKNKPLLMCFKNVKEEGDLLKHLFDGLHDLAELKRETGMAQDIVLKRPS